MEFGKNEYLTSCAPSHGVSGKGDGPVAEWLSKPSADLTMLTENNKDVFPVSRVYDVIDSRGRDPVHEGDAGVGRGLHRRRAIAGATGHVGRMIDAMIRVRIFETDRVYFDVPRQVVARAATSGHLPI
jgi:hypothetical protein